MYQNIFDSHAHYNGKDFEDRDELLPRLFSSGVCGIIDVASSMRSTRRTVELSARYDTVYSAIGVHPNEVKDMTDEDYETLRELSKLPKVVAIGEIGFDFYWDASDRDIQREHFERQLILARELDLPVIVHEREAHEDALEILAEFPQVTGVFHCYSGSAEMAKLLVSKGWYIGFTGVITFKNARKLVETALSIPLDRMVIETDCPYMAPEPFRGRRNDPGYLYRMAERLAELRGVTPEEMQNTTLENGKRLYRLN